MVTRHQFWDYQAPSVMALAPSEASLRKCFCYLHNTAWQIDVAAQLIEFIVTAQLIEFIVTAQLTKSIIVASASSTANFAQLESNLVVEA